MSGTLLPRVVSFSFSRLLQPAIAVLYAVSCLLYARPDDCSVPSYGCALQQIQRGETPKGIGTLQAVLEKTPDDLKALNLMGIAHTQEGRLEEANQYYRRALDRDARFYPALKNLARNELTLGRTQEAKKLFLEVINLAPGDEVTHLALAELYFGEEQCGAALQHYGKAPDQLARNPISLLNYASCHLQAGQRDQAFSTLGSIPPADGQSQLKAGLMLSTAGAYAAAAKHFGLAQESLPDPYTAGYNRTLAYIRAGALDSAIQTSEDLFAKGYRTAELYSLTSQAYLKTNQIEKAYSALRTATQLEPKIEDHYVDLASICFEYSNYDLGIEIIDVGIAHLPDSARLYVQRGSLSAMKGKMAEAERDFESAAKLAPNMALPYVALGTVRMQTGRADLAVEAMRAGAKVRPENYFAYYMLARALIQTGVATGEPAEKEAFDALDTSIRVNPDFWHSRVELGKLLLKRGELDRAIQELERAVDLAPDEPTPAHLLVGAYRRKGDTGRADELNARLGQIREERKEDEALRAVFRIVANESSRSRTPEAQSNPK